MSETTFQHECTECKKMYEKKRSWVDPSLFSKPENANITYAFWCSNRVCEKGQVVLIQMLPDTKSKVLKTLDYKSIVKEDSPSYFSKDKDDEDNDDDTDGLTQKIALTHFGLNLN